MPTALVTGASRGIGKAIAELLAASGYQVLINYRSSQAAAETLLRSIRETQGEALLYRADVANRAEVQAMFDYCVAQFGGLDLLVNNAGIAKSNLCCDIDEAEWDEMIDVNLKSAFLCSQNALRFMTPQKRGKIINISSIWGITGAACEVHYSAAKAGLIGLTKALAKELGPSNIQVNCLAPGVIATDMLAPYSSAEIAELTEQTPLQRLGAPRDIAQCVLFLASDAANFITGQVISPNGGFVI